MNRPQAGVAVRQRPHVARRGNVLVPLLYGPNVDYHKGPNVAPSKDAADMLLGATSGDGHEQEQHFTTKFAQGERPSPRRRKRSRPRKCRRLAEQGEGPRFGRQALEQSSFKRHEQLSTSCGLP